MDCSMFLISASSPLMIECTEFRNDKDKECTALKRIGAELCYAGILVIALVEMVVRAFFILPGLLVGLACSAGTCRTIHRITVVGTKFCLAVAVGALFALVKNPCEESLDPRRDLIPQSITDWALAGSK